MQKLGSSNLEYAERETNKQTRSIYTVYEARER